MNLGSELEERPLDLTRLFEALARHGVVYVVIGGVATQVHGHRRTTMDLDLTPGPDPENLGRLAAALEELEARPANPAVAGGDVPVTDAERLVVAAIVPPLITRHGQVHVLKEPKGGRPFEKLRDAALVVEIDGIEVAIASLDDLIRMKRAAARPPDLEDIAALTRLGGRPPH
jgi:hypothetical protein